MTRRAVGILLAAGSAERMGFDKLTTPLAGRTAVERSMDALLAGGVTELVIAASPKTRAFLEALACPVPKTVVMGGDTRQASVRAALRAVADPGGDAVAVIHDAARCFVAENTVRDCIASAETFGSGIAATAAVDTVLRRAAEGISVVPRDEVLLMQTPQAFRLSEIRAAYERASGAATDDCTLYLQNGGTPRFVEGGAGNIKLTSPADWARAEALLTRYGTGYDTHRLVEGRRLVLGGVEIPFATGLLGHSDADVLLHAIIDALLGAAAMGDIGKLFPDSDERYRGADSRLLLRETAHKIRERGLRPVHVDATIIAERPKLAPYIGRMRENIAADCGLPPDAVSVKATTTEGMHDEGRGLCITAEAIASAV